MFRPLAYTIAMAMVGSLLFSLTVAPVLASAVPRVERVTPTARRHAGGGRRRTRSPSYAGSSDRYRPLLAWALDHQKAVIAGTAGLIAARRRRASRSSAPSSSRTLNEGTMLVRATMAPSISLSEATATVERIEREFLRFPEVTQVVSRIGRGEVGAHADPVNNAEIFVDLKPRDEWETAGSQDELVRGDERAAGSVPGRPAQLHAADRGRGGRAAHGHEGRARHQALRRRPGRPARQGERDCGRRRARSRARPRSRWTR